MMKLCHDTRTTSLPLHESREQCLPANSSSLLKTVVSQAFSLFDRCKAAKSQETTLSGRVSLQAQGQISELSIKEEAAVKQKESSAEATFKQQQHSLARVCDEAPMLSLLPTVSDNVLEGVLKPLVEYIESANVGMTEVQRVWEALQKRRNPWASEERFKPIAKAILLRATHSIFVPWPIVHAMVPVVPQEVLQDPEILMQLTWRLEIECDGHLIYALSQRTDYWPRNRDLLVLSNFALDRACQQYVQFPCVGTDWEAISKRRLEIVSSLLNHGAPANGTSDEDEKAIKESWSKFGPNKRYPIPPFTTPLYKAAELYDIRIAKLLVAAGASIHRPNHGGGYEGETPCQNSRQSEEMRAYFRSLHT